MKLKKILFITVIIVSLFSTLYISYNINLNNLPSNILNIFLYKYNKKIDIKFDLLSLVVKKYKVNNDYFIKNNKKVVDNEELNTVLYNTNLPIVYIYNTHTNEEYSYQKNDLYNITPTVLTASFILKSELESLGIESIVETNNVTDIINEKEMPYSSSYKISRELLENKKLEYPSLMYFVDLHRDSVKRSITTTTINDKVYAKTMFLLGLENENYKENKHELEILNNYLDKNYKGLSRGIYEKKGSGVNGVYNQDFSKNTMLIEVGGQENTIDEVANSIKVIALMLKNYISSNNMTNFD
ncbi:MAG: stage II sporulation protein P [Bacilli bacterium]|nr:stage II sporulation protein P [Bacilli bacterium]